MSDMDDFWLSRSQQVSCTLLLSASTIFFGQFTQFFTIKFVHINYYWKR